MMSLGDFMGGGEEYALIFFNETSRKGNPMGRYNNMSVFAADGYRETIKQGSSFYCRMIPSDKSGQFYNAIPVKELTLREVLENEKDLISKIASYLYELDHSQFDQAITAVQLREIEERAESKSVDKINRLEKEVERLTKELNSRDMNKSIISVPDREFQDYLDGDIFYSKELKDQYYSARINRRGDMTLLVKDKNGEYGGYGKSIDLSPLKKMMGAKEIKAEYCHRYDGIVVTKLL